MISKKNTILWIGAVTCIAATALYATGVLKPKSTLHETQLVETGTKAAPRQIISAELNRNYPNSVDNKNVFDVSRFSKSPVQLPQTNEHALFTEFSESKDFAAFVRRAKATEGGAYFVRMALLYCGSLDAQTKAYAINKAQKENKTEERMASINSSFGACATMPTGLELRESLQAIKKSNDRSVALSEAFSQHLTGHDEGNTAELISRAISYGNPLLVGEMLSLMVPTAQSAGKADVILDNKPVAKEDADSLAMAMNLIACNYGVDCSGQSSAATSRCALGGPCGVDEFEIVRRYNMTPVEWEKVVLFYSQILQSYQSGNYGFINVVKRKP